MFVHYREKFSMFFCQKSNIFILLHLSTASGSQKSSSIIFQRKHTGFVDSSTEHLEFQKNIPGVLYCYPPS